MRDSPNLRTAWFVVLVLLLASAAAPLNQFKVPPVMPLLMDSFNLSIGSAGLLMSVFAITGLILALPAGFISQKLGYRLTGLLAIGSVAAGAAIGAVSLTTGTILFSRIIEGAGTSLIAVVAPAVVAMWFTAKRRGAPMGVWATWVPVGSTIMLLVAPLLARGGDWRPVWWFGSAYAVVVGAMFILFVRPAPSRTFSKSTLASGESVVERITGEDLKRVLRNRNLWLLSLIFCCFNIAFIGFVTWAPTFLNSVRDLPLAKASFLVSITPMLNIGSCPFGGWLSDRIGSRKVIIVIPMIVMAALWPVFSVAGPTGFLLLVLVIGWISGFVPTGLFAAGPELVGDERLSGMAVAILQVGMNAGMLLGPLVLGWLIASGGGWPAAFGVLAPVCLLGAVAGWAVKMR